MVEPPQPYLNSLMYETEQPTVARKIQRPKSDSRVGTAQAMDQYRLRAVPIHAVQERAERLSRAREEAELGDINKKIKEKKRAMKAAKSAPRLAERNKGLQARATKAIGKMGGCLSTVLKYGADQFFHIRSDLLEMSSSTDGSKISVGSSDLDSSSQSSSNSKNDADKEQMSASSFSDEKLDRRTSSKLQPTAFRAPLGVPVMKFQMYMSQN